MIESINEFHRFYEKSRLWKNTKWLGIPCWKLPFDAFMIQELIFNLKPDYIIETGTGCGGSALFYATICEMLDHGKIITCDIKISHEYIKKWNEKLRKRIEYISGGSTNPLVVKRIKDLAKGKNNIVILDSWHTKEHVSAEMALYSDLIPENYYMIVEDTHVNGHPVEWEYGEGPYEAVQEFLILHPDEWEIDKFCEKYVMTFNPNGFLKRIKVHKPKHD